MGFRPLGNWMVRGCYEGDYTHTSFVDDPRQTSSQHTSKTLLATGRRCATARHHCKGRTSSSTRCIKHTCNNQLASPPYARYPHIVLARTLGEGWGCVLVPPRAGSMRKEVTPGVLRTPTPDVINIAQLTRGIAWHSAVCTPSPLHADGDLPMTTAGGYLFPLSKGMGKYCGCDTGFPALPKDQFHSSSIGYFREGNTKEDLR
ncbi:hypothetical protein GWK47_038802 [Chionoecetes opilio]|uniref:Uncharacterized protein n=1 Tax=Chionoecetes opilio TaxID=41210 RepID=A0A8J4YKU7_CHIOP|nr:hypothetical protein GWK47_038802 [Chionoecetes opilio]